jgi:uncharacterized protein YktB (UPF0637 family)
MGSLRFSRADFEVFSIEGFSARMEKIHELIRPRLIRLGSELAPELSHKFELEFFPHIAKHMRATASPPAETWIAWGPSPTGYKRYGYLALCVSGAGIHARAVVKAEVSQRVEIGQMLKKNARALEKSFRGNRIQRYEKWDGINWPKRVTADAELFIALGAALEKKTGTLDVGFGWGLRDAARLDRNELLDAFGELEPLYRVLRAVD